MENQISRLVALLLLAACLLFMATGCPHPTAGNTPAASAADIAGTYALASVDGTAVPCAVSHEGHEMTVKSGSFAITTNGQCTSRMTVAVGDAGQEATVVREATYERSGRELLMQWKGFGRTKGQVAGNEFTMNNEGMVFVYRK